MSGAKQHERRIEEIGRWVNAILRREASLYTPSSQPGLYAANPAEPGNDTVDLNELTEAMNTLETRSKYKIKGPTITFDEVLEAVSLPKNKDRFDIEGPRVRNTQGHSKAVKKVCL